MIAAGRRTGPLRSLNPFWLVMLVVVVVTSVISGRTGCQPVLRCVTPLDQSDADFLVLTKQKHYKRAYRRVQTQRVLEESP